jgi:hypothetical protein
MDSIKKTFALRREKKKLVRIVAVGRKGEGKEEEEVESTIHHNMWAESHIG